MSAIFKHRGRIRNGKLVLKDLELYRANLEKLEGKQIYITINEETENTTLDQQKYLRGIIYGTALQSETFGGWSKQEIHDYYCDKFLSKIVSKEINGEMHEFKITKSTSGISKKKMSEFIELVKNDLASEHNVVIKDINDYA